MNEKEASPLEIRIEEKDGKMTPSTGTYVRYLSDLRDVYYDTKAFETLLMKQRDTIVYEVSEFQGIGSDLIVGTTTMYPGRVGDEFFMTRGHFHKRRDRGEIYYTQSGKGLLLLQSRSGKTKILDLEPGLCTHIPPDWAHRSVNTGSDCLIFLWVCSIDAGQEYDFIVKNGMRNRIIANDKGVTIITNP